LYITITSTLVLFTLVLTYNTYKQSPSIPNTTSLNNNAHVQEALDHLHTQKRQRFGQDIGMYYAQILSQLIQCKTISHDASIEISSKNSDTHSSVFDEQALRFHSILEASFPNLHAQFPPKKISTYSLVYEIVPPKVSDIHRPPILFCSHLDVVPASYTSHEDGIEGWLQDPFGGAIVHGCVWGRGGWYCLSISSSCIFIQPNLYLTLYNHVAVDNKCNVLAQLAAIENILSSPQLFHRLDRILFVAIGHDEEIGGTHGAAQIATYFSQRQLSFEYILDEGNIMVSQFIPGMKGHLALIGTVEKGMMNVELSVSGLGGHASMPPIHAEGNVQQDRRILPILLRALLALENHPSPGHFGPLTPLRRMLEIVARQRLVSFPMNIIFSNFWFFGPLVKQVLTRLSAGAAASIRTTTAITRIMGGDKLNSLPTKVKAYINHRIHPNDSIEGILKYDQRIINNPKVAIRLLEGSRPPSRDSGFTSSGYQRIETSVRMVFDLPSAPSLVVGNTDSYWYWSLSDQIYRFLPIAMSLKDATMVHGYNERIEVKALWNLVQFYETLILLDGIKS